MRNPERFRNAGDGVPYAGGARGRWERGNIVSLRDALDSIPPPPLGAPPFRKRGRRPTGVRRGTKELGTGDADSHASVRTEIGIGIWTKNESIK